MRKNFHSGGKSQPREINHSIELIAPRYHGIPWVASLRAIRMVHFHFRWIPWGETACDGKSECWRVCVDGISLITCGSENLHEKSGCTWDLLLSVLFNDLDGWIWSATTCYRNPELDLNAILEHRTFLRCWKENIMLSHTTGIISVYLWAKMTSLETRGFSAALF